MKSSPQSVRAEWAKCDRATDTNLKRAVAIKVLPDAFAPDDERLARFQREARSLPRSIIRILRQSTGWNRQMASALVMELVEGPTLEDRIRRGAIPIEEALGIAKQIAEALEAAHERGHCSSRSQAGQRESSR